MERQKVHLLITLAINLSIVVMLIRQAWEGNDKAIILVIAFYPVLVIVNAIAWGTLKLIGRGEARIYRVTTLGLMILFIPVVLIAAMY